MLIRGYYQDAEALHQQALGLARRLSQQPAELRAQIDLGYMLRLQGRYQYAVDHLARVLQIAQQVGDRYGELADTKVVLCGLWTATLFVLAYVDIFGFFRADVINGVLAGEVSNTGLRVDQTFLLLTTTYIWIPALLAVVSLVARTPVNRIAKIAVSLFYVVTAAITIIGETWCITSSGLSSRYCSCSRSPASPGHGRGSKSSPTSTWFARRSVGRPTQSC